MFNAEFGRLTGWVYKEGNKERSGMGRVLECIGQ